MSNEPGNLGSNKTKKLIVLCDGTWKTSDNGWSNPSIIPWEPNGRLVVASNVVRIGNAILAEDKKEQPQVVYYQAGVGTGWHLVDKLVGGATGAGLSENIREAYSFIANNYAPGDSIFILGFSRGAYTARSIGGLIGGIGLLEKDGLPFFYDIFRDWENTGRERYSPFLPRSNHEFKSTVPSTKGAEYLREYRSELLRLNLTREVKITAIGVWDTVGSLGIPTVPLLQTFGFPTFVQEYKFTDTGVGNHVLNAFQALALDERRSTFAPAVWEKKDGVKTNLKQVWFPGVHSNVGGGFEDANIADICLAWMMSQLSEWIAFDPDYIAHQHALNQKFYDAQQPPRKSRGWGLGKLYESLRFPYSLLGYAHRTPGMYTQTDYESGRSTGEPLKNTNERIHSSVRARIRRQGLGLDDSSAPYKPNILGDWEQDTKSKKWTYHGDDYKWKDLVLPEDSLGRFEIELLKKDPVSSELVLGQLGRDP